LRLHRKYTQKTPRKVISSYKAFCELDLIVRVLRAESAELISLHDAL